VILADVFVVAFVQLDEHGDRILSGALFSIMNNFRAREKKIAVAGLFGAITPIGFSAYIKN
jgi:hypothetical protein